ncbi:hypothetical protein A7R67_01840 [Escherichia coli]|nr:hypothetical protein A7R67_01840 [Escherichia coli]
MRGCSRITKCANGITAIFGVSGAGKTSLINAISGLTRPQKGRIVLNGRVLNDAEKGICLTPEKRRVGYVFQDARLFPHYKVRQWHHCYLWRLRCRKNFAD